MHKGDEKLEVKEICGWQKKYGNTLYCKLYKHHDGEHVCGCGEHFGGSE